MARSRLIAPIVVIAAFVGCEQASDPPLSGASLPPELSAGKWNPTPAHAPQLTDEQQAVLDELNALGYADALRKAPELVRVTIYDSERASPGLNFYTSGHASEAFLIDMHGEVLHRWSYDYDKLWPDLDVPADAAGRGKWRRAHLFDDGSILAIHEGIGMIKLDRESNLIWEYPGRVHHDIHVLEDGTIWTLAREAGILPRIHPEIPCMDDFVVALDPDGRELCRISVLESLENAGVQELLERISVPFRKVLFHTNSIEVLDGRLAERLPAFAAGNVLVSLRHFDAIAVIDIRRKRLVWWMTGDFKAQHEPTMLEDGNLLLFDNRGAGEASTVYEFDPVTRDMVWFYRGTEAQPFYSKTCGTAYRLPNGNTLITESDAGRAFEVMPEKEIVWEFYSPHRGGPDRDYIACLYDLQRIEAGAALDWLRMPPQASH